MIKYIIPCLLHLIGNLSIAQQSIRNQFGIFGSYGLHSNVISDESDGYSAFGTSSVMLWFVSEPKGMQMAFEPRLGLNSQNYNFQLSDHSERLSYKMIYAELSINANFSLTKKKNTRLITGIFLKHHLYSDPSVIERGEDGLNQLQFSGELDRISEEEMANKLLAGFNIGYRFNLPKIKRWSFEVDLQQEIVDLFAENIEFNYTVNKTRDEQIVFNGKPSILLALIRYQLI